jgi:hypothetical protein
VANMTTTTRINTCRYCGKRADRDWLVKYGTRAYAHPRCYIENKTMNDAAVLPLFERRKLGRRYGIQQWRNSMNIKDETLVAMAAEIRTAINAAVDDYALAMAALNAFVSNASLSDWDELETEKPQ